MVNYIHIWIDCQDLNIAIYNILLWLYICFVSYVYIHKNYSCFLHVNLFLIYIYRTIKYVTIIYLNNFPFSFDFKRIHICIRIIIFFFSFYLYLHMYIIFLTHRIFNRRYMTPHIYTFENHQYIYTVSFILICMFNGSYIVSQSHIYTIHI